MITKKSIAGVAAVLALAPFGVFAQATDTTAAAQAQALMQQIRALQEQLKTLMESGGIRGSGGPGQMGTSSVWQNGSSTPPGIPGGQGYGQYGVGVGMGMGGGRMHCPNISRDLNVGSSGEDVKQLQEMLRDEPGTGFTAEATGYFGPMTAMAMRKYQMQSGISQSGDGRVGPLTRNFFKQRCGLGQGQGQGQRPGQGQGQPGMMLGTVRGNVAANNTTNIVIQPLGTSTVVAHIGSTTRIQLFNGTSSSPTIGTVADLTVDMKVQVSGPRNADGSIQAMMIMAGDFPTDVMRPIPPMGQGQGGPGMGGPRMGGPGTGNPGSMMNQ